MTLELGKGDPASPRPTAFEVFSLKYNHALFSEGTHKPSNLALLILTAEDTHVFKPALEGFEIALETIKTLRAAQQFRIQGPQSLTHDIEPAAKLGVDSVWIDREGSLTGRDGGGEGKEKAWKWRFETLAGMADAVEGERRDAAK
ncbi:hypothetical protein BD779DRAFT_1482724 [Infundibulicybe gibba]|nr:hypothetical protein BD779DRAFT_1482724 [Infundibulicybe gibba]